MKQTAIKVLDEKDLEFIEALRNLKVPGTWLHYLLFGERKRSDFQRDRNGNKHEAARSKHRNACIAAKITGSNKRNIKAEGKGRPMIVYKFNVPLRNDHTATMKKKKAGSWPGPLRPSRG